MDIDSILSELPEELYQDLMDRIDEIKAKYKQDLLVSSCEKNLNIKEEENLVQLTDRIKRCSL